MLYTLPQSGPAPIVRFIEDASGQLGINVYYLHDRLVLRAIRGAVDRGVTVFVIVDGKPYGMSRSTVQREIAALEQTGAHVETAPARFAGAYRFDHAKYAVSHGEAVIGSANWDWRAFHRDRDYIYTSSDPAVVASLQHIFHADWANKPTRDDGQPLAPNLVVSPGSESQIVALIDQSGPVEIETEELGDNRAVMRALEAKGSDARIIFPVTLSESDRHRVAELQSHGVQVRFLAVHPVYMHAKMILGPNSAFIGSENFSDSSLQSNREVGIVLNMAAAMNQLRAQFEQDWTNAVAPAPA